VHSSLASSARTELRGLLSSELSDSTGEKESERGDGKVGKYI
jgi:hypothetical protein